MKRMISFLLAFVVCLNIAGCSGSSNSNETEDAKTLELLEYDKSVDLRTIVNDSFWDENGIDKVKYDSIRQYNEFQQLIIKQDLNPFDDADNKAVESILSVPFSDLDIHESIDLLKKCRSDKSFESLSSSELSTVRVDLKSFIDHCQQSGRDESSTECLWRIYYYLENRRHYSVFNAYPNIERFLSFSREYDCNKYMSFRNQIGGLDKHRIIK